MREPGGVRPGPGGRGVGAAKIGSGKDWEGFKGGVEEEPVLSSKPRDASSSTGAAPAHQTRAKHKTGRKNPRKTRRVLSSHAQSSSMDPEKESKQPQ
jgi:hypothetical protein